MNHNVWCTALFALTLFAIWRAWRIGKRCEKLKLRCDARLADIVELRTAIDELTRERVAWISENVALRNELAEWRAEAERRIVESQEGSHG